MDEIGPQHNNSIERCTKRQKSVELKEYLQLSVSTTENQIIEDEGIEKGNARYRFNNTTANQENNGFLNFELPIKTQQERLDMNFFSDQNNHVDQLQNNLNLSNRGLPQKFEVEWNVPTVSVTPPIHVQPTLPQPLQSREIDTSLVRKTRKNLNNFALKLNKILYKDGSFIYSPFSIFIALGLVLEGAQKNTQKQILKMLELDDDNDDENSQLQSIRESYQHFLSAILFQSKKNFKLFSANRFYGNSNVQFSPEYKQILQKYYFSDSFSVDFQNDAENERQNINSWVQKITQDQIKNLLPPRSISPLSVSVLVNALYFEGSWEEVFDPEKNEMRDFRLKDGSVKKVEMMVQKFKEYSVSSDFEDCEDQIKCIAIKMPYDRRSASLHIVLPQYEDEDLIYDTDVGSESGTPKKRKKSQIEKLLEDLTEENLNHVCFYGEEEFVDLYLPKFSIESDTQLSHPLKQLGMTDAFEPSAANFGGMVQNNEQLSQNVFISEGYHKTKITVDETGTIAASATAFGTIKGIAPKPRQFEVNQPFLFMVVAHSSKTILFSGVVEDPSQT
eukprot:TRINITY_DN3972_c0_g1_i1.p1 TRINITY_DN3972_c0_g1~~TRINITY_DN3972_c0_g1_i1.p1  ORF type:complete len:560 (+),score=88.69 TRINITY_DN3972_c0_g1_i1:177-1856(+)